jgi:hypothetical protein
MKGLYVVQLCLIVSTAFAQPTFTSGNCFHVGLNAQIAWAFSTNAYASAVENTSETHVWDFSFESWAAPTGAYVFQTGLESGNSTFANSEINESATATFVRELFYSYSEDEDTLYYDGLAIGSNYAYNPSVPYFTFPMQYGDSLGHHTVLYASVGGVPTAVGSTTRQWMYDGYGSVHLPYGNQNGVYRIRTRQIDSTYITNFATTYEEIIWLRASDGLPVLRFQNQGGMLSVYYASVDGAVTINEEVGGQVLIYPNPATDVLSLQLVSIGSSYRLIDQLGRIVEEGKTTNYSIDISSLESGVYFLSIMQDENWLTTRFVKE